MTYRQRIILIKVNERIDDLRNMFDDFFVKTMNKKYGANYTMWAYMEDIVPIKMED